MNKIYIEKRKKNLTYRPLYSILILTAIFVSVCTYIIFIYKTVHIASSIEKKKNEYKEIYTELAKKEYIYIDKIANLHMEKALENGYIKQNSPEIVYFKKERENSLAFIQR